MIAYIFRKIKQELFLKKFLLIVCDTGRLTKIGRTDLAYKLIVSEEASCYGAWVVEAYR